jgi:hypothetical protein
LNFELGKGICRSLYQKDELWETYPLDRNIYGDDILFIHIPKCAGTSIANAYGRSHLSHYPSSVFYLLDDKRYLRSTSFAIVREPLDRIASMIAHFSNSRFASQKEVCLAREMGLSEENMRENIVKFLTDESFRFKLFNFTKPGKDGFPMSQLDYLTFRGRFIVRYMFSFNHLDSLASWLTKVTGKEVMMPHSNSSNRKAKFYPDNELIALCKEKYPYEYALYETLNEAGGFLELSSVPTNQVNVVLHNKLSPQIQLL